MLHKDCFQKMNTGYSIIKKTLIFSFIIYCFSLTRRFALYIISQIFPKKLLPENVEFLNVNSSFMIGQSIYLLHGHRVVLNLHNYPFRFKKVVRNKYCASLNIAVNVKHIFDFKFHFYFE